MANFSIQEFIADDIIVDGDDLVVDGNTLPIKQKLVFLDLHYRRDLSKLLNRGVGQFPPGLNQGGNSVTIRVVAIPYHKAPDGGYGKIVEGGVIREYEFPFIANQTTWVDANSTTGEVIGNVGEEADPKNSQPPLNNPDGSEYQEAGKFFGKTLIKEGQFYDRVAELGQVNICDLIRQAMTINKHRCQPSQNRY